jgi:hypothetical protein
LSIYSIGIACRFVNVVKIDCSGFSIGGKQKYAKNKDSKKGFFNSNI